MNKFLILITLSILYLSAGLVDAAGFGERYACPMLCVITDHAGSCPVCGMEMAAVESGTHAERNSIELDDVAIQRSAIRTAPAIKAIPHIEIPMVGKVVPDETRTAVISAWTDGRIDRLYADYTGIEVKQGEKLAELYSPELINAQQELILAVQHKDERMTSILRKKLSRYGIDEKQIDNIAQQPKPLEHLAITAPAAGTVLMKNVSEGSYVKRGQLMYRVSDLSLVWLELQAYESDLPLIKPGQMVMTESGKQHGTITFVEPSVDPNTRTAGVRVTVANPNRELLPEMLIRAIVHVPGKTPAVLIPASAPLFTGKKSLVYVKIGDHVFEGREVTLGPRAGDQIVIESGILPNDEIVINGAFHIDAAMQISGRPSMMNPNPSADAAPPAMHQHGN